MLAGYTVGSAETINLFLKELTTSADIFEKVMDHLVPNNYYNLKNKAINVVKARQLINALKYTIATLGRFGLTQAFRPAYRAPTPSRPPLHIL